MKSLWLAASAACFGILAGCGGSNSASSQVNGNYALQGTPASSSAGGGGGYFFGGPLTGSSSGIHGTFHILDSANCIPATTAVPVTGSDSGTNLRLTTGTVVAATFTIKGTITSDGATLTSGTYQVTGGCLSGQGGTITGFRVAPFTGMYTGNLTVRDIAGSPTTTQFATTANLTQSGSADANGFYSVSGPLTVGSSCFDTFGISSSQIFGTQFILTATPGGVAAGANVPTLTINAYGTDASAKQISGSYTTANMSAACSTNGFVVLTHP